mmetsp:Transcript_95304/g.269401  ORF Transcript_95304/g.269401 Transcript_95304/m.269401 type:complete len:378 (-) Transcript_95304:8-1141(-)
MEHLFCASARSATRSCVCSSVILSPGKSGVASIRASAAVLPPRNSAWHDFNWSSSPAMRVAAFADARDADLRNATSSFSLFATSNSACDDASSLRWCAVTSSRASSVAFAASHWRASSSSRAKLEAFDSQSSMQRSRSAEAAVSASPSSALACKRCSRSVETVASASSSSAHACERRSRSVAAVLSASWSSATRVDDMTSSSATRLAASASVSASFDAWAFDSNSNSRLRLAARDLSSQSCASMPGMPERARCLLSSSDSISAENCWRCSASALSFSASSNCFTLATAAARSSRDSRILRRMRSSSSDAFSSCTLRFVPLRNLDIKGRMWTSAWSRFPLLRSMALKISATVRSKSARPYWSDACCRKPMVGCGAALE